MRTALFAFITLVALLAACGDDVADPDSGVVDSGADGAPDADAGEDADAAVDAGPPALCAPCRRDADCAEGALCLVLDGGERGCGTPCADATDCETMGFDAECAQEVPGLGLQCRPTGGTCVTIPVGAGCMVDSDCGGRFDHCVDADGLGSTCTGTCSVDADCPIGARRCREVVEALGHEVVVADPNFADVRHAQPQSEDGPT